MYLAPIVTLSGVRAAMPSGDSGVFATVRKMRALVNQYKTDMNIRGCALHLLYLIPQKFDCAECESIFDFVRDNIRYTKDVLNIETLSTPVVTLQTRQGDCDDKSTLLAALLESAGYQTRFVVASYVSGDFEHVYVQVCCDGEWITCDTTENYPFGWEPPAPIRLSIEKV